MVNSIYLITKVFAAEWQKMLNCNDGGDYETDGGRNFTSSPPLCPLKNKQTNNNKKHIHTRATKKKTLQDEMKSCIYQSEVTLMNIPVCISMTGVPVCRMEKSS